MIVRRGHIDANILYEGNGHGVDRLLILPTDVINQGEEGGIDGGDGGRFLEEGGEEDGAVDMLDEYNCCVGGEEDVAELVPVLEDEEDKNMVDLLVVDDETGGSILKPCRGYMQGVIGAHRYPGCDTHMHMFCGDAVGEAGLGKNCRCPGCVIEDGE